MGCLNLSQGHLATDVWCCISKATYYIISANMTYIHISTLWAQADLILRSPAAHHCSSGHLQGKVHRAFSSINSVNSIYMMHGICGVCFDHVWNAPSPEAAALGSDPDTQWSKTQREDHAGMLKVCKVSEANANECKSQCCSCTKLELEVTITVRVRSAFSFQQAAQ